MAHEAADYSALSNAELEAAELAAVEEFNAIDRSEVTPEAFAKATEIAEKVNEVRSERKKRMKRKDGMEEMASMVNPVIPVPDDNPENAKLVEEPELVMASTTSSNADVRDIVKAGNSLNASLASLSDAARHVPSVPDVPLQRQNSLMTAGAEVPGFALGGHIPDMDTLVDAYYARSRNLPDKSGYVPVASMNREFRYTLHDKSTKNEIDEILKQATDPAVLTAAGGWCAPSEISYQFYNIVEEDGILDLPTVGIIRGGLQFPTSASFGDVIGDIWTWSETQDIAAATGTGQSGTKPCFRVPCPSYNNVRLGCVGLCLTMGNLMNEAFPELVANHMRLLFAAHAHFVNTQIIQQLVAGSTAVNYTSTTGHGLVAPTLEAVEQQVADYRIKFRMASDALLEAVFPDWIRPMFRADLSKRTVADMDFLAVTDEDVNRWFEERDVRVQFVQDFQVGAAGQLGQVTPATAWPTQVSFLLYAAGTWIRGNGLRLDLGVIRDSTLNQTNDYTAAWMEECFLTARIGHESRYVTIPICPNGATQAGITMGCTG